MITEKDFLEALNTIKAYNLQSQQPPVSDSLPSKDEAVSGWRSFKKEKPLDDQRYYYSQGNQFFTGVWSDKLKGFLLDGCGGKYISMTCDYFHVHVYQ
jgi:hypothetical protein